MNEDELIRIIFKVDHGDNTTGVVHYLSTEIDPKYMVKELVTVINDVLKDTEIPQIPVQ